MSALHNMSIFPIHAQGHTLDYYLILMAYKLSRQIISEYLFSELNFIHAVESLIT